MATSYSDLLKDPRWQKKRLEIMERDEWKCRVCGSSTRTLNIHHLKYSGRPWEADDNHMMTLCESCHTEEESYKRNNPVIKKLSEAGPVLASTLIDFMIAAAYAKSNDTEVWGSWRSDFKSYYKRNLDIICQWLTKHYG